MAETDKEAKALLLLKYKETGDKSLRNGVILAYMNIVKFAAMSKAEAPWLPSLYQPQNSPPFKRCPLCNQTIAPSIVTLPTA